MDKLKHLQSVILYILKDIDALCRRNNIDYFLAYGSALGAIRHKGFIPWDDDIDIILNRENYNRLISCAKSQLDSKKYYVQEGLKDWPMPFSKIKLRGTHIDEHEGFSNNECTGIYVDVFCMDNAPANTTLRYIQYFFGKLHLSYALSRRTFQSTSLPKKILMLLSAPLKISCVENFVIKQITKYNREPSEFYCCPYTRYRFKGSFVPCSFFGKPLMVDFEGVKMPVPSLYHDYLTYIYGDYMTPPPANKQVALHIKDTNVEFGNY